MASSWRMLILFHKEIPFKSGKTSLNIRGKRVPTCVSGTVPHFKVPFQILQKLHKVKHIPMIPSSSSFINLMRKPHWLVASTSGLSGVRTRRTSALQGATWEGKASCRMLWHSSSEQPRKKLSKPSFSMPSWNRWNRIVILCYHLYGLFLFSQWFDWIKQHITKHLKIDPMEFNSCVFIKWPVFVYYCLIENV